MKDQAAKAIKTPGCGAILVFALLLAVATGTVLLLQYLGLELPWPPLVKSGVVSLLGVPVTFLVSHWISSPPHVGAMVRGLLPQARQA